MCVGWGGGGEGDVMFLISGFVLFFFWFRVLAFCCFFGGSECVLFCGLLLCLLACTFFLFFFAPLYSSLIDSVGVKTQLSVFVHGLTMLVMCCYTVLCFELFLTLGQVQYK